MTNDLLGYTLEEAKKILDSEGYKYHIELYTSPKQREKQEIILSSRIIKIIELENKNINLIVSNF